jgi:acyl-CoA thioester hydrolase
VNDLLAKFPRVIELPLEWGDMDAFQHVNNTVYFRWFESARIAYFQDVGLLDSMATTGVGPILASTDCRFRIPLDYPDTVSVGARVPRVGADRFVMEYLVVGHRSAKAAANGTGLIVSFDYRAGRKAPLPADIVERLRGFEATAGNQPESMAARV